MVARRFSPYHLSRDGENVETHRISAVVAVANARRFHELGSPASALRTKNSPRRKRQHSQQSHYGPIAIVYRYPSGISPIAAKNRTVRILAQEQQSIESPAGSPPLRHQPHLQHHHSCA